MAIPQAINYGTKRRIDVERLAERVEETLTTVREREKRRRELGSQVGQMRVILSEPQKIMTPPPPLKPASLPDIGSMIPLNPEGPRYRKVSGRPDWQRSRRRRPVQGEDGKYEGSGRQMGQRRPNSVWESAGGKYLNDGKSEVPSSGEHDIERNPTGSKGDN